MLDNVIDRIEALIPQTAESNVKQELHNVLKSLYEIEDMLCKILNKED